MNSSLYVIWCNKDTAATYKLSDILLEYDSILDEHYAITIDGLNAGTTSIPHAKVKSIHFKTLSYFAKKK